MTLKFGVRVSSEQENGAGRAAAGNEPRRRPAPRLVGAVDFRMGYRSRLRPSFRLILHCRILLPFANYTSGAT